MDKLFAKLGNTHGMLDHLGIRNYLKRCKRIFAKIKDKSQSPHHRPKYVSRMPSVRYSFVKLT